MKAIKNALLVLTLVFTFTVATTSCSGAKNKAIEEIVDATNKELPMQIDSETKLDKVTADGNSIIYHYSITDKVNKDQLKAVAGQMKIMALTQVKANVQLAPVRALGTSFKHIYFDKDGNEVTSFVITEEDYK